MLRGAGAERGALHPHRQERTDYIGLIVLFLPDGYAMLMTLNKVETAVHGCHCPGVMAVRMRKVLARPWVGVRVCHLLLSLLPFHILEA